MLKKDKIYDKSLYVEDKSPAAETSPVEPSNPYEDEVAKINSLPINERIKARKAYLRKIKLEKPSMLQELTALLNK